jgi:hydroxypyruvate reductase
MADLKQLARRIFHETLAAIDIPGAMQRKLRREGTRLHCDDAVFDLRNFDKLRVVAIGKAAHAMVSGLAAVLVPFVRFEGVVSAPTPTLKPLPGMKYFVGGHPMPSEESWKAAEAILALLKSCDEKTLVFFLLSGGASALVELPLDRGMTLEEVQQVNRTLVTCGAPIETINAVRKHVSAVKGGRLATAASNATKITLAVRCEALP